MPTKIWLPYKQKFKSDERWNIELLLVIFHMRSQSLVHLYLCCFFSINQSINQLINQSVSQSISQLINQSINQLIKRSSARRSVGQSVNNPSINQSIIQALTSNQVGRQDF